ncbi:MAG: PEP-CTERM sorting domain-containing protein [Armatimonadetes bacterium]|nr:PEP-CTERM sorting domain-containing protein [Armatimonadota bacterium]
MNIKVIAAGAALIACQSAFAGIAYDNFGPGDTYNTNVGYTANNSFQSACQFTSADSGRLLSVTVGWSIFDGPNSGVVTLYNDNSNQVGSFITSWGFTNQGGPFPGQNTPVTLTNAFPSITLTAGQKYWVEVAPGNSATYGIWNFNNTGAGGLRAKSQDGGATYTYDNNFATGSMRIETVPEPASMVVLGLGALALRRRRKA